MTPARSSAKALRLLDTRNRLAAGRVEAGTLGATGAGDIEALAFIVLMEAMKSMDEDLKAIMAEVKAMTAAKRKLRELIGKVHRDVAANATRRAGEALDFSRGMGSERAYRRCPMPVPDAEASGGVRLVTVDLSGARIDTVEHLHAVHEDLKGRLDGMTETSEMESLRLQMHMDRRSKLMSTLSDILKRMSPPGKPWC